MKESNNQIKSIIETVQELPIFTIDHFLEAVNSASERSRQILIISIFSSLIILMALINSLAPEHNWNTSRSFINKTALNYVIFPGSNSNESIIYYGNKVSILPINSMYEYVLNNEKLNYPSELDSARIESIKKDYEKYYFKSGLMLKNPKIASIISENYKNRKLKYNNIKKSIDYIIIHNILDKESMTNLVNKLDEAEIEHLNLVRVPILGISFDINYLGIYSGATLVVLYLLLYFSLLREHRNLIILFRKGWNDSKYKHHYYFYEYVSMLQVLSFPRKLFEPERKFDFFNKRITSFGLFAPVIVLTTVFIHDLVTFDVGKEINEYMAIFTSIISGVLLTIMGIISYYVRRRWNWMDDLWDNQAVEFNFEYILEQIGEDNKIDFVDVGHTLLNKEHVDHVKRLWYINANRLIISDKKINPNRSMKIFNNFINESLRADFNKIKGLPDDLLVEKYWSALKYWFEVYGRKNVTYTFQKEFAIMLQNLRS